MFDKIQRDVAARIAVTWIDDNKRVVSDARIGHVRIIKAVLTDERLWPIVAFRYHDLPLVGIFFRFFTVLVRIFMGVKIAGNIGPGFSIGHASCVFLNKRCVLGRDVRVNQGVTIAGTNGGFPIIGDDVHIAAGAKILGPVRIGKNVHVGANSVVVYDVPDNSTVAGVPARLVKIDGNKVSMDLREYWKNLRASCR